MDCTSSNIMEVDLMEDPLGLRLAKRRSPPGLYRKNRPRAIQIRQSQPQQPPAEEDLPSPASPAGGPESDDDSSDDEADSPSPTTTTFPSGTASPTTLPSGSGAPGSDSLTNRPVAQGAIDPSKQAQDPTTGIVFGSVGAASICLCLGVGIWWLCRYRRKKRLSKVNSSPPRSNTGSYMQQANLPPNTGPPQRAQSNLMDQLLTAAYDVEQGAHAEREQQMQAPYGYLNEKRYDPSQQLPILQPAPVTQPTVRWSIASWVRRHNPLRLNPVGGRSSMYSTSSSGDAPARQSVPPVPPVPAAFQSKGQPRADDEAPLVPRLLFNPRAASSLYSGTPGEAVESPVSAYARNSGAWVQRDANPGRPQIFVGRAVSMAPTEVTTSNASESTWASWGAGVSRPQPRFQQQQQQQPATPRRAWIERCVNLGGWK